MEVTVVNDSLTMDQFAKAVRTLCQAASSSSSTLPSSTHSVGLDCEWQPSRHPDPLSLSEKEDHPVATLQLAFKEEVFVIDMQTICGFIEYGNNEMRREQSDEDNPMRLLGFIGRTNGVQSSNTADTVCRRTMSTDEDSLCRALGELFSHQKVSILGFAVQQDLQKLAASYPHMLCFQRVIQVFLHILHPFSHAFFRTSLYIRM
jgi:hypothetical protein